MHNNQPFSEKMDGEKPFKKVIESPDRNFDGFYGKKIEQEFG